MKEYGFYGWETANESPQTDEFARITSPRVLYDALIQLWCAETCAPRMRAQWAAQHPSWGQCSITAFLVQDIFGGKVYGVLRPGGNYHCYNVIGSSVFDLTSEQFGDERLDYTENPEQLRSVHFAKAEKAQRYQLLREKLRQYCAENGKI